MNLHVQQDEPIIPVNHKGGRCIYPQGPPTCQEGMCSNCAVRELHREN